MNPPPGSLQSPVQSEDAGLVFGLARRLASGVDSPGGSIQRPSGSISGGMDSPGGWIDSRPVGLIQLFQAPGADVSFRETRRPAQLHRHRAPLRGGTPGGHVTRQGATRL
eukprot:641025-Prymnesium_polylepis.1